MISLMSDSRVAFLIWFIVAAIVVAVLLIFIEIRLKKKRARDIARIREQTPIDRMNIFLNKDVGVREKLDIIGKTAKDYFKEEYNLPIKLDYGELDKEFKNRGMAMEAIFCKSMFEAYYSNNELTKEKIRSLADALAKVYRHKVVFNNVAAPGFWDRFDGFLETAGIRITRKIEKRVNIRNERLEREARVKIRQEHELSSWVRRAINMGYDKMKIAGLLSDEGNDKKEVKKVLRIYDKEAVRAARDGSGVGSYKGGGVAQRILQGEKDRLEKVDTLVQ